MKILFIALSVLFLVLPRNAFAAFGDCQSFSSGGGAGGTGGGGGSSVGATQLTYIASPLTYLGEILTYTP